MKLIACPYLYFLNISYQPLWQGIQVAGTSVDYQCSQFGLPLSRVGQERHVGAPSRLQTRL